MQKDVENLINLGVYQTETSLWDTNNNTHYDADKRLQTV